MLEYCEGKIYIFKNHGFPKTSLNPASLEIYIIKQTKSIHLSRFS